MKKQVLVVTSRKILNINIKKKSTCRSFSENLAHTNKTTTSNLYWAKLNGVFYSNNKVSNHTLSLLLFYLVNWAEKKLPLQYKKKTLDIIFPFSFHLRNLQRTSLKDHKHIRQMCSCVSSWIRKEQLFKISLEVI